MRKLAGIVTGIGILLALVCFPRPILSADKSSNEFYQEFLQNYRKYQTLLEPFHTQRSRYFTYQSVSSQADFMSVSKSLVSAELEAITSYTNFIRTYLAEATQILNYTESYLYVMLDDELSYLSLAKQKASTLESLLGTQSFLQELLAHNKRINQIGYQIKSVVIIGSANKTLGNIKIEADKLDTILSQIKTDEVQSYAAREKMLVLRKELQTAEDLVSQASQKLKSTPREGNFEEVAHQVEDLINQSATKFSLIISGYKNIVESLK